MKVVGIVHVEQRRALARGVVAGAALAFAAVGLVSCAYPPGPGYYGYYGYDSHDYYSGYYGVDRLDPSVFVSRGDHFHDVDRDRDHDRDVDRDHDHDRDGFGHGSHH